MEKHKEKSKRVPVRVGISIGDVNGIGPEVIMKALNDARMLNDCTPIIYGSTKVLSFYKKGMNLREFNYQTAESAEKAKSKKINVINIWKDNVDIKVGADDRKWR